MRAEAGGGAGRDDDIVEAAPVGPAIEDEGLGREVLQREVRPARQAMAGGQGGRHVLLQQRVDREALGVGEAGADEGDVQALLAQAGQKLARAGLLQHEGDVGPVRAELADGARHQRMERRRGGEAHGDAAGLAARRAAGPCRGAIDRGQHRLGIGQEGAAGVGQRDAARMADEQRRLDLLLQRLDLLRQRRLLHVQLLGRARDVALVGHGDEVAEMAQFHESQSVGRRYAPTLTLRKPAGPSRRVGCTVVVAHPSRRRATRGSSG